MKKILPQANNLNTLIKVFIYYSNKKECSLQDIADFCNFEIRQASYYLNACVFLGLIDEDNKLSQIGKEIITDVSTIRQSIYIRIITDDLIGKIFSQLLIKPKENIKDFTCKLILENYPDYSMPVIERRASTIINWCQEIIEYVK